MNINLDKFSHVYKQLLFVALDRYPGTKVSFTSGLWEEEEGYKRKFWDDARESLELETWQEHQDDYQYICSKAVQPFGILMRDTHRQQNLVSQQNYNKLIEIMMSSTSVQKETAKALYAVFFDEDEKAAFEKLAKVLSKKSMNDPISIASLYFFLKDKNLFVTARREGTGERLSRLGLNAACLQKCTWEGYNQYIDIVKEIRQKLLPYQPEATLLDAQSFLWMLWMVNPDTPEYIEQKPRVLFCNIAWMEAYDHRCFPDDKPRHGGAYVDNTGAAFECWNFHRYEDGYYGFVETGYSGETANQENAKQLHIENIDSEATGESIDGVTVVFCARSDIMNSTVIVGWYDNAIVYRKRKQHTDGHIYNIQSANATLLPEILRTKVIPRSKGGHPGFGRSNIWYASDNNAKELVKDVIYYIDGFKTENSIKVVYERTIATLSDDELKRRIGQQSSSPAPVYNAVATLRKRNPYLPEMAKRRANGVCQLCGNSLDFTDSAGRPFLEAHHIIPLAEDGADELSNMSALCPNCHRKMHIVGAQEDIKKLLQAAKI